MTTALLERPLVEAAPALPASASPTRIAPRLPVHEAVPRTVRWPRYVAGALLAGAAVLLGLELRGAHLGQVLAHAQPWQLGAAVGWIVLSLVAAAYNLTGFSAVRVPLRQSLLAQLAISGLRVITPSAISTPVVATRFLTRSGASLSDAMTTVGAAQGIQLIATVGVVAGLAVVSDASPASLPPGRTLAMGVALVLAAIVIGYLLAKRSARVGRVANRVRDSAATLARHARSHPSRVVGGVLASAALTLTHVLAFAACVAAAGGHVSVLTLAAVYLGAATAGSLLPTPGGIGGVEAALIAGLTAAGLSVPVATAATLLSRLVAVWLPAVPGWWAVLRLRRAQLL